jgi:DNA-binding response OmpR family regulator
VIIGWLVFERIAMFEKPFAAKGPAATTVHVVLVVQDELRERVSTAKHLRQSGFDVIEAADGDEARRVLDAVRVDVVFADLEMPGQTNGLGLLRWLSEHRPAIKTILTSGTETNLAAVEGYGIFLSKPYRMLDLDYCLQRVLAAANIPAGQTAGAMSANRTQTSAGPNRRPAPYKADGRSDKVSKQSMAELSRWLAERAARQRAIDPDAAIAARRAALQAYDRARARRMRMVLGFALGAVVGSAIANLGPTVGSPPIPLSPSAAAHTEPASSVEIATATPEPIPPEATSSSPAPSSPSPPASVASAQPSPGARTDSATADQPAPVELVPNQTPLRRDEVREVQARLQSFGINPGPVDGAAGAMTAGAVMRYQQERGQSQRGTVDRELLEQLRQDPAPPLAQGAARHDARATRSPAPRRFDPFEPVRTAGNRLGQWLEARLR